MNKKTNIVSNLYQFTDETALIVVAAKQEGRVFKAGDGQLELIEEFRIDTPHFSDNEAPATRRGDPGNEMEQKIHAEYFEHFKKLFHSVAGQFKPTHAYLFAPAHVIDELEKVMKPIFGTLPTKTVVGIFTHQSPFELLKRLK